MKKTTCHTSVGELRTKFAQVSHTQAETTHYVESEAVAHKQRIENLCWQHCVTVDELRRAHVDDTVVYDMQDVDLIKQVHDWYALVLQLKRANATQAQQENEQTKQKMRRLQCIFFRLTNEVTAELLKLENVCFGTIPTIVCNDNIVTEHMTVIHVRLRDELDNLSNNIMQIIRKRALIHNTYGHDLHIDKDARVMATTHAPSISPLGQKTPQLGKHYFIVPAYALENGVVVMQQAKRYIEVQSCTFILNMMQNNNIQIAIQHNDKYVTQFIRKVDELFPKLQLIVNSWNLHLLTHDMALSTVSAMDYSAMACAPRIDSTVYEFDYYKQCIVYVGDYSRILTQTQQVSLPGGYEDIQKFFQYPQYERIVHNYVACGKTATVSDARNMRRCIVFSPLPKVHNSAQKTLTPVYDVSLGAYILHTSACIVTGLMHHILRYYNSQSYTHNIQNVADKVYILVDYEHSYVKQHNISIIQALMYSLQACIDYVQYSGISYLRYLWHTLLFRESMHEERSTILYRRLQQHLHSMQFIVVSDKQTLLSTEHAIPSSVREDIVWMTDIHREIDINFANVRQQLHLLQVYSDVDILDAQTVHSFQDAVYKYIANAATLQEMHKLIDDFYCYCVQSLESEHKYALKKLHAIVSQCFRNYVIKYNLLRTLHADANNMYTRDYQSVPIIEDIHQPMAMLSHLLDNNILVRRNPHKIAQMLQQVQKSLKLCIIVDYIYK